MAGRKVLVYFEKRGDARFLSHLDLQRLMERAIRRSRLEVDFTEGFNPHIRMSLPPAAPVGVETSGDCFCVRFDPGLELGEIEERLAAQLPEGIRVLRVEEGPPPREPRRTWLSVVIKNGQAAAAAAATALREGDDPRFSRAIVHEDAVIIELSGGGSEDRPPRVREVVEHVEAMLRALGFFEGTGVAAKQTGQPPDGAQP